MALKVGPVVKSFFKGPKVMMILGLFFLGVVLAQFLMPFRYVQPYEYGIKQINISTFFGSRGLQERVYTAGYFFVFPFGFEQVHILPKDIQLLDFSNSRSPIPYAFRDRAVHIQTSDGFYVNVDVSILYHISDPFQVINTIGPGNLYIENGILPKAEPVLKDTLGELTTEDFYNPNLRVEKMLLAKDKLNEELNAKGIVIDEVMVRYFKYSDEIQRNIEDKKLKDQLVFKNQAEASAAIEEAKVAKVVEEGEASLKVLLEEGAAYVLKRNAGRDLYMRKKYGS